MRKQYRLELKKLSCRLSIIICFLLTSNSFTAPIQSESVSPKTLKPFVATYLITAMGLEGINVTNSLSLSSDSHGQQAYHFKSYSMTIGLLAFKKDETRDEQSKGLIIKQKIHPDLYSYKQIRKKKTKKNVEINFDWEKNQVTNHHINKHNQWIMPITVNTVDKLSYQLSLMLKLANQPEKKFSFKVADGGKLKEYHFEILAEERVFTSMGSYKALKVQHQRYHQNKKITLWCVPELNFLPVKIIQEETDKPTFISTLLSYQEGLTEN
ncbi:MAG: DUF3108 domain-containing protein [gamma proteobacterium symbiont of Taylorina sp.]|nr:DUF3108 domain-containing protein [gamma proteobacterium symbiont of Taylorina sp.]